MAENDMKRIFEIMEEQKKELAQLRDWKQSVEAQKEEEKADAILNAVSDVEAMEARDRYAVEHPDPVVLININAPYKDNKTKKYVKPTFTGKKDLCPFCTDVKKQPSLLDVTNMGRWACRMCGKHWYEESLGQPYSKAMERSFKTGATQDDPIRFMKDGKVVTPTEDARMKALEETIAQLKSQIEAKNGHKEEVKK